MAEVVLIPLPRQSQSSGFNHFVFSASSLSSLMRLPSPTLQTSFINFSPPPQYKKDFFIYDFCEEEDARCLAHFAASKMRQTRRSRSILPHNHQDRWPRRPPSEPEPQRRRTVLTPPTQPAGADVQEAEAGGALDH